MGNVTAYVVPSADASPFDPSVTWAPVAASPFRYVTGSSGAPPQLIAGVHLPQGASVVLIEVDGCDGSSTGSFSANLWSASQMGGGNTFIVGTGSEIAYTGCAGIEMYLDSPVTIDNELNVYYVTLLNLDISGLPVADGSTYVTDVKLFYQLQVSQAPGTPTFNDVAITDPGYQFIEALAASGITGGCGGGNYCPDNPVTRRQIAVFFAKALGLYWQN